MTLILHIDSHTSLPGANPSRIEVPDTGLSAGRSASMGWVLPDDSRHVSGHHFDVSRQGDGWWLRDMSTNGTFLQGQRFRLDGPHRLRHGDRFQVGPYLITALIEGETTPPPQPLTAESLPDLSRPLRSNPPAYEGLADLPPPPRHEVTGIKTPAPAAPASDVITAFCNGAGLPPDLYAQVDAPALALALGQSVRRISEQIMLALQDRAAAKQFTRAGEGTMQAEQDNNPLKFLPTPDQAIEAMFLRPRPGFLTGPRGLDDALADLRLHQSALFAALQPALARLLADLAPDGIEAEAETNRQGGNRAAKAWEIYAARWRAKTEQHDNGMLDEFLDLFADAYRNAIDGLPVANNLPR
ncbi:MAG: type VI secretion system-associated FHA domain protein TagH [Paracoccus sp. (in: a-proteobacteria)]|uniref:type VI secretion system-associated FHA domain protein TagH n=1 Tax=Paracoccus sp. TaxID=267 RepID=UPI0026DFCB7B|nr:type VI secretion system-associated FHA domain protein TagH [Paracoccus sp. (in: a-proteobacteria)]MDO5631660.1 type VI secretion system-associated FHA domain protein TagH [Paracoccus sp. (in: a-proteobacteria)]